jgi:lysophospholipase L1-like esterase
MHIDMLKPKVKVTRYAADAIPAELPEHAFEVIVEPGIRREIGFVEPPVNAVKRAFPGRIDAPHFFEQKLYTLRYDKDGFLAGGRCDEDPDTSVVMLGDSTSEDRYLDEPARMVSLVGVELRALTGKRINVHNAAVSGANSVNSLLTLFVKVLPMRPVAATMMHVSNDLKQLLYFGSYWQTFGEPVLLRPRRVPAARLSGPRAWARLPVRVWRRLVRVVAGAPADQPTVGAKEIWWEYMTPERGFALRDPRQLTEAFAQNLNLFVSMCRDARIVPVLLTQPNRLTPTGPDEVLKTQMSPLFRLGMPYEEYKALFDAFNETVRRVAKAREAMLVDLAAVVPQEARFMWDSLHLTAAGAELAARPIAAALAEIVNPGRAA